MPFTVGAALEAVAAAAGPARFAFDGKLLGAGHAANLTRLIRKGVSLDDFQLLGEWLAAGQHWSRAAVGPSWLASGTFGEDLAKARTWAASGRPGGHSMPRSPQTVPATPHEAFASETEHTDFRGAKP